MTQHDDITRLQESQLFLERRLDELHEATMDLSIRLQRAVDQLARLESRMDALSETMSGGAPEEGDGDSPPDLS